MQQKSVDFLRIDINNGQVRKSIAVCQSDPVMRTLSISIVDSGAVIDLSTVIYAEILIKKADGFEADMGCVINDGSIEYTLRSTDIAAIGTNLAQIMLTYEDGSIITTPPFEIRVFDKVLNPKVQKSMNEYTAITEQVVIATNKAKEATDAAADSKLYKDEAAESALAADESAVNAKASEGIVFDYAKDAATSKEESAYNAKVANAAADSARISEQNTYENMQKAFEYGEKILSMEVDVEEDANRAEAAANRAENQVLLAKGEVDKATNQVELAKEEAEKSRLSADTASSYANAAAISVEDADAAADLSMDYSLQSKSYALGATGVRENEETNNAKYFYEKCEEVYRKLGSALVPKGTITFEQLPSFEDIEVGYMYNISNGFVTDERFRDGSGKEYGEGNNVYYVVENGGKYWDVLSGASIVRKASASQLGISRPDNNTITIDDDGVLHGADSAEECTYEYWLDHQEEIAASGKTYYVTGNNQVVMKAVENVDIETYLADQAKYDGRPWFVNVLGLNHTASNLPMESGESVQDAVTQVNENLEKLREEIQNVGIKSIQRGSFSVPLKSNSVTTITLENKVNPEKCMVIVNASANNHQDYAPSCCLDSITETQIKIRWSSNYNSNSTISWQVVEYN